MFENILVPLDGSVLSQRAAPYAEALASAAHGKLILMRAAEAHAIPGGDLASAQLDAVREAEQALSEVCEGVVANGVAAEWHVYYGSAAEAIEDEIKICQADSVVMSTHARGGLAKLVYGSVAQQVVARTTVPVLLIPAMCSRSWPASAGGRILVPLDRSNLAEAALEPAIELARTVGSGLLVVGLVQPAYAGYGPEVYPQGNRGDELQSLRDYLSAIADRVRARGVACSTMADIADPAAMITDLASGEDMIAVTMATHGRSGLAQVVMGSVASSVVQRASVPVLVVNPLTIQSKGIPGQEPAVYSGT